jgi:hypothetical protein
MAEYICKCEEKHEENKTGVMIRFGDDGAYHEVKNPKTGAPTLHGMDNLGRSFK